MFPNYVALSDMVLGRTTLENVHETINFDDPFFGSYNFVPNFRRLIIAVFESNTT